jgi:ABC-2 type transport system permease protein
MIISFLGTILLVIYSVRNVDVSFWGVLLYVFLLICAFLIYYNIIFFLVTFAFWIIDASDLVWFADDLTRFGTYPLKVYPALLGLIFLTVIPVMLLVYVPVTALLNFLDWKTVVASLIMVVVTSIVSEKFWQVGLRHYSSASS